MTVSIRTMQEADLDAALALWRRCPGVGLGVADAVADLVAFLRRNPACSQVAERDGVLLGTVLAGHDGRRGYLYHLAVEPQARGRGLGRRLVAQALAALVDVGIAKAHIMVFNDNSAAQDFWRRCGWQARSDIGVMSRSIG